MEALVGEPAEPQAVPDVVAAEVLAATPVEATVTEVAVAEVAPTVIGTAEAVAATAEVDAAAAEVTAAAVAVAEAEAAGEGAGGDDDDATAGQKRRRNRQSFNRSQVSMLEHIFVNTPMPRQALLNELSGRLDIPARSVRVWFQNRRQRWKAAHLSNGLTPPALRNAEDRLTSLEKLLPDLPQVASPGAITATAVAPGTVTAVPMIAATPMSVAAAQAVAAGGSPATGAYRAVRLVGVHGSQPVFRMEELTEVPNLVRTANGGLLKIMPTGVAVEYAALGVNNGASASAAAAAPKAVATEATTAEAMVEAAAEAAAAEVPPAAPAQIAAQ